MTDFDHKLHNQRALEAAGWTNLEYHGGYWFGAHPAKQAPHLAPSPSRDVSAALEMARPFLPLWNLAFYGKLIKVIARGDDGEEIVIGKAHYADCGDRADLTLAWALTLAMREMKSVQR
jgi:hypothetical protein